MDESCSAEISTSEEGTISHEADQAIYKSSAGTLDEQIARWEKNADTRKNQASAYRSTSSTTTTTAASGFGRTASPTVNIGTGSARQAVLTETVRTTSTSSSGAQTTPEGFVLVPVSSARAAGIGGREISANSASNLSVSGSSGFRSTSPLRSTTTVTRTQTSSSRSSSGNRVRGGISTNRGFSTSTIGGYQPGEGSN